MRPDAVDDLASRLERMRADLRGAMLDPEPGIPDVVAITTEIAMPVDSLNYMSQTISWRGVRDGTGRTFVRCLRDRIQPRALQAKLVENCGATSVIDLDSGHTPALSMPAELARILDRVADDLVTTAPA